MVHSRSRPGLGPGDVDAAGGRPERADPAMQQLQRVHRGRVGALALVMVGALVASPAVASAHDDPPPCPTPTSTPTVTPTPDPSPTPTVTPTPTPSPTPTPTP